MPPDTGVHTASALLSGAAARQNPCPVPSCLLGRWYLGWGGSHQLHAVLPG